MAESIVGCTENRDGLAAAREKLMVLYRSLNGPFEIEVAKDGTKIALASSIDEYDDGTAKVGLWFTGVRTIVTGRVNDKP